MKTQFSANNMIWVALCALFNTAAASAATLYVWQDSPSPEPPHTNWAMAAHTIQDAVDAAQPGDTVLVTNGVYATGGRAVGPMTTNRLVIDKAISVRSVNGPDATVIQGHQVPGTKNGDGAVRCVYVASGAVLYGFTLTKGATWDTPYGWGPELSGGGVWSESASATAVVSNCVLTGNSAAYEGGGAVGCILNNCTLTGNAASVYGGGASRCTLNNCTLTGNSADYGGGAAGGTLNNCTLTGNSADHGGGAADCTLHNCTLTGNRAGGHGGGATGCTLNTCTLTRNSADYGGGASWVTLNNRTSTLNNCTLIENGAYEGGGAVGCTLNHCTLTSNGATVHGGGACGGILRNCTLNNNTARYGAGGGAHDSTLNNCTVVGNSADHGGGGVWNGTLNNCIVYFNNATNGMNFSGDDLILNYSCTTPLPPDGLGNLTNEPAFVDYAASNLRLRSASPCINAGLNAYAPGSADLDGRPRIVGGMVDMGAYEFQGAGMSRFIGWLQQYGLPTDGSADFTDTDGDGLNQWQEWRCRTDPTNALSVLRMLPPVAAGSNVNVSWQSVAGVSYFLERSKNLTGSPPFQVRATNIVGQAGRTTFTDTNAAGTQPRFYRVTVP